MYDSLTVCIYKKDIIGCRKYVSVNVSVYCIYDMICISVSTCIHVLNDEISDIIEDLYHHIIYHISSNHHHIYLCQYILLYYYIILYYICNLYYILYDM